MTGVRSERTARPSAAPQRRPKYDKRRAAPDRLAAAAAGLEAELSLLLDGTVVRPEDVFGDPRGFISLPLLHRTGGSFHLPTGAAVYFDTGVIEIATPPMELTRGCFGRLARSLDVAITLIRVQLDEWERRTGRRVRLQGFSTHYNVSLPVFSRWAPDRLEALALVLVHVLPFPVMLLTTNRQSTGVGVRPRPGRIEVTADFAPDARRVAAAGAVIAGVVRGVSRWPQLEAAAAAARGVPLVSGFQPMPHSSRRGWVANTESYRENPFAFHPDEARWNVAARRVSTRTIAHDVLTLFDAPIRRTADADSYRLVRRTAAGQAPSWLEQSGRPIEYDDVGRARTSAAFSSLGASRYERVVMNTLARAAVTIAGERWTPLRVRGWSRVVLRRDRDGARRVMSFDRLLKYW